MRIAIVQSNYIPWRGYFDLIRRSDAFVLLDSVQYTRRDWRNRNAVRGASGLVRLTIPVSTKGKFNAPVDDIEINDPHWIDHHLKTISHNYRRAPYYETVWPELTRVYGTLFGEKRLSRINETLIRHVCKELRISTPIIRDRDILDAETLSLDDNTGRLLALCKAVGADHYLSGGRAKGYLNQERFESQGINVEWMSYENYPEYPQVWPSFEPHVSIIDFMMNVPSNIFDDYV